MRGTDRSEQREAYSRRRNLQRGHLLALLGFGGLSALISVGFGRELFTAGALPVLALFGGSLLFGIIFIVYYGGPRSLTTQAILVGAFIAFIGFMGLLAPLWQPLTSIHGVIDMAHAYFGEVGSFIGSPQLGSLLIVLAGLALIMMGGAGRMLLAPAADVVEREADVA